MTVPIRTTSPYPMLTVAEATHEILSRLTPLPPVEVGFRDARRPALAEDVTSPAICRRPTLGGGWLRHAGPARPAAAAGAARADGRPARDVHVDPDTAVRIMTGGVLPPGRRRRGHVRGHRRARRVRRDHGGASDRGPRPGRRARRQAGSGRPAEPAADRPARDRDAGDRRQHPVLVHPRPRVAVLATGDEVVEPEVEPPAGYVRDSNRYALIAACRGGPARRSSGPGHCARGRSG